MCRYVGGSWNREGTILLGAFGDAFAASRVSRLAIATPVAITNVDASQGEQDTWPVFLPDGHRFLFTRSVAGGGVATYLGSLDGDAPKRIADGSRRIFVPPTRARGAYLLGIDASGLVAQPFDLKTLRVTWPASRRWSRSRRGVGVSERRAGHELRHSAARGRFPRGSTEPAVPSDRLVRRASSRLSHCLPTGGDWPCRRTRSAGESRSDIWLLDFATDARTRLTFNRGSTRRLVP